VPYRFQETASAGQINTAQWPRFVSQTRWEAGEQSMSHTSGPSHGWCLRARMTYELRTHQGEVVVNDAEVGSGTANSYLGRYHTGLPRISLPVPLTGAQVLDGPPVPTCGCHSRPARGDCRLAGAIGRSRRLVLEGPAALLPIAIVAIHRPVASGQEGDLSVLAALGAHRGVHLSPHSAATVPTAIVTPGRTSGLPAGRASLRLVGVALLRMILLVVYTENETLTALHTS